jgi:ribonuclease VapC
MSAASPREVVLDTFAVLAYLQNEAGAGRVSTLLEEARRNHIRCRFSAINVGEVMYNVERRFGEERARQLLAAVTQLPLVIEDVTWERILAAAHLKARHAVSYADSFAVALAQEFGATVVTGDPEFRAVETMVNVEWLPRS